MLKTALSTKGQIIIPQAIREAHQWLPGLEFTVIEVEDGILLSPIKPFKTTTIDEVFGCTGYKGKRKSLSDMEKAIEKGAKKFK